MKTLIRWIGHDPKREGLRTPHGADYRRRPCKLAAGERLAGISELARVVDGFARRPLIRERVTAEIAGVIDDGLWPQGVGVVIEANHACMSSGGVHESGASMATSRMLGVFNEDAVIRGEFLASIRQSGGTDVASSRAFT